MRHSVENLSVDAQVHPVDTDRSRDELNSFIFICKLFENLNVYNKSLCFQDKDYWLCYELEQDKLAHRITSKNFNDFMFECLDFYQDLIDKHDMKYITTNSLSERDIRNLRSIYNSYADLPFKSKYLMFRKDGISFTFQVKKGARLETIKGATIYDLFFEFLDFRLNVLPNLKTA